MEQIKHIIGYGMIVALTIISSHSKVNAQVPANELDSIHAFNSPSGTAWELQSRVLIVSRNTSGMPLEALELQWDNVTMSWQNNRKDYMFYNQNDSLIGIEAYTWDNVAMEWVGSYKYKDSLDASGKLIEILNYSWNAGTKQWDNSSKRIYIYDSQDRLIEQISQQWDNVTMQWVNYMRYTYSYDAQSNLINRTRQDWISSAWENVNRSLYAYSGSNKMTEHLFQTWDNVTMIWKNSSRRTYTYNSGDLLIDEVFQLWDDLGATWDNSTRTQYTYDNENNEISRVRYQWDDVNSVWKNNTLYTKAYYNGLLIMSDREVWNNTLLVWENGSREVYSYDEFNNLIYSIRMYWDAVNEEWINSNRRYWQYDSTGQRLLINERHNWSNIDDAWKFAYKEEYFYTIPIVSDIVNTSHSEYRFAIRNNNIYVLSELADKNYSWQITNTSGQVVMTGTTVEPIINIADLSSGTYVLYINAETQITWRFFKY